MQCPRCQAQNDQDAKFCEDCGARLEAACPSCGRPVGTGKKFCRSCGASLVADSIRFTSPQVYTPKHLAEKILTSKAALEGERKQVTVLFADLKGSMELLADRDPEEARKLLDPVLEHMMEAVHRYEGTVNQVMGDGIMALFGAPLAHEDHAVRGCYAALRMQESVKRYAEEVRRTTGIPIQIRIGLNSGEVVVRAIGSDLHMDYTAVGQTTHLAARMEQMALPGTILVTPETLALAEGFVQIHPLGPITVKGLATPIEVYELSGVSGIHSRLQAAAARGLSRFVGRDAEMEQLRRALEQARQGNGQVAAVIGEPGVGKSRLVFELTHSHRVEGWLVLESVSVSYGKATSYLPIIQLLKGYFRIGDGDSHRGIREKVTGKLLTLDRSLEPILPALLGVLVVPVDHPQWQGLDPPQRRQRTLDAIKRLLLREAQVQPLLLVFEDLHWIDAETQALLDSLVESLPTARLLLLTNYRPEYSHGWGSKTYYTQLRLDTLPLESATALLDTLLGFDTSLPPLKTLLVKRTGGNPFFLEESVRTLVETKALLGERGAFRLSLQSATTIQVPATVQSILAARMDRLAANEKRILQTAAVIGKDFSLALLQTITDEGEEALRRGLTHLQTAEFIYETNLFPDIEYTFKHALTHEVAYGSLLTERRRALHARIAEAMEIQYTDRLMEHIERLAHHAFQAEKWETAILHFRRAGAKARDRAAFPEAVAHLDYALEALRHLPESRLTLERGVDLRLELRSSLHPLAQNQRILECLDEATKLAERLGDPHRSARLDAALATQLHIMGDAAQSLDVALRAVTMAKDLEDLSIQAWASHVLGQAHHFLGNYRAATAVQQENLARLTDTRESTLLMTSVYDRVWLAWSLAELGDFDSAMRVTEAALRLADELGRPWVRIAAVWGRAFALLQRGDLHNAVASLERGLSEAQPLHIDVWIPVLMGTLGHAYTLQGRTVDALPLLEEAVARAATGNHVAEGLLIAWLGEALLRGARREEASRCAQRAAQMCAERRERGHEAHALRALGEIAADGDAIDVGSAERHYRGALALAVELGMRPLVSHCHLGLGRLYRRTGKGQEAQGHLATATGMYREMDMRFWLEQTEAEMKEMA